MTAQGYHFGLLFGISHPGPSQEGCGYCDDTLKAAGYSTLAAAYLAGAKDGRALGHAETLVDAMSKQCGICSRHGHTSDEHAERIEVHPTGQATIEDEQEGKA